MALCALLQGAVFPRQSAIGSPSEAASAVVLVEEGADWLLKLHGELSTCTKSQRPTAHCHFRLRREPFDPQRDPLDVLIQVVGEEPDIAAVAGLTGEFAVAVRRRYPHLPLIFDSYHDPRRMCLVRSLERPGNMATGIFGVPEVGDRLIELLVQAYPSVKQVVVLIDDDSLGQVDCSLSREAQRIASAPTCNATGLMSRQTAEKFIYTAPFEATAARLGRAVRYLQVCRGQAIHPALKPHRTPGVGLVVPTRESFYLRRVELVNAVNDLGIPAFYQGRSYIRAGGLMALAPKLNDPVASLAEMTRQVVGGRPISEIPVEQSMQNEVVFNREIARQFHAIPQADFLRIVDEFYVANRR